MFFFEKNNQKTFDYVEPGGAQGVWRQRAALRFFLSAARLDVTIFASFFQKRRPSFLPY
jgi:hypothetical protein